MAFQCGVDQRAMAKGGKAIEAAKGVQFVRMERDRAVLKVGSGKYRFTAKM